MYEEKKSIFVNQPIQVALFYVLEQSNQIWRTFIIGKKKSYSERSGFPSNKGSDGGKVRLNNAWRSSPSGRDKSHTLYIEIDQNDFPVTEIVSQF